MKVSCTTTMYARTARRQLRGASCYTRMASGEKWRCAGLCRCPCKQWARCLKKQRGDESSALQHWKLEFCRRRHAQAERMHHAKRTVFKMGGVIDRLRYLVIVATYSADFNQLTAIDRADFCPAIGRVGGCRNRMRNRRRERRHQDRADCDP